MLTEAWYADGWNNFILRGFNHFHGDRTHKTRSGVALHKAADDFEVLSVLTGNTVFPVIYHLLNSNVTVFLEFLQSISTFVMDNNSKCIIGSDLNIDMLTPSSCRSPLSNFVASYNHDNVRGTFITNCPQDIISRAVVTLDVSNHLYIYLSPFKSQQKM